MREPLVWVVGAGGLLGSRVLLELGADGFCFTPTFTWNDPERLHDELRTALRAFVLRLSHSPGRPWAIAWCAGAGVVATSASALAAETAIFSFFLQLLAGEPALGAAPGHVLLASSAGGVYGASVACPISESTPPMPGSPYGRAKLAQEELLLSWARSRPAVSSLVARISNLYGPGQRLAKPQGLISHMSRCLIYGAPVHIYVSLDTIRDYLFAEDAGRRLILGLRQLAREAPSEGVHVTKLYASEHEVSIAGLLGVFRQIARRKLRVVSGLHAAAALQPHRLQFRSQVWPRDDGGRQVELLEGVSRVYRHQLVLFRQGLLPPPSLTFARR